MGASLKKAGCGVPQIVLRDAALSKMIGSDKAAVGAEIPRRLPPCLVADLSSCRLADLSTCRLVVLPPFCLAVYIKVRFSPPILASPKRKIIFAWCGAFSGMREKSNLHYVVFLHRKNHFSGFSGKIIKSRAKIIDETDLLRYNKCN